MHQRIRTYSALFFSLVRESWQIIRGGWYISKLPPPVVSIFGGAKMQKDTHYFKRVEELSAQFMSNGISVLTGGGPGIMEGANCGAHCGNNGKGKSIGIGVKDLEEKPNPCVHEYFELEHFFARKWLLTRYSQGFVVFPGGFGTLDELTETLTLMTTNHMKQVPIVLIGTEFWNGFIEWIQQQPMTHGLISKEQLALIILTDDLNVAFCTINDNCKIEKPKKS